MNGLKSLILLPLAAIMIVGSAGCGSETGTMAEDRNGPPVEEPVTIQLAVKNDTYFTDEEFDRYIAQPVKKRYPQISVEKVPVPKGDYGLLISQGNVPDIAANATAKLSDLVRLGFTANIEPLLKSQNFDLKRLEPLAVDVVKIDGGGEYLIGLPYDRQFNALYYNKDIFDKFGVPYPQDGMTWDQARELAKKVTRAEDGVQIRGLEPDLVFRAAGALGTSKVDPKTKKAAVNTPQWKRAFDMLKSIYEIPGNSAINTTPKALDEFGKDKRLAMLAGLNWLSALGPVSDRLNWDMASFPTFQEAPATGTFYDAHVLVISNVSKHKESALKVLEVVLSDEVQGNMAQNGRFPLLVDKKVKDQFGQNLPYLKGKNVQAIFKTTPAAPANPSEFDAAAHTIIQKAFVSTVTQGVDANTALNQAEEQINQYIADNQRK